MNRKTKISLGIIAALILIIVVQKNVRFSGLPSVKPWKGTADEIIIKNPSAPEVRLFAKNGKWFVNTETMIADGVAVEDIEKKMKELKLSELVTEKGYYERFDLSENKAVKVSVKLKDKTVRDIFIGKKSSAGDLSYVKFPDKPEVYLAEGELVSSFAKNADSFRERRIITVLTDLIDSFEIKGKLSFVRELQKDSKADNNSQGTRWTIKGRTAEINQDAVTSFIKEFSQIQASSFPDAVLIKKLKFAGKLCEVNVKSAGKEIAFDVFGKETRTKGSQYLCYSSDSGSYMMVDAWQVEKLINAKVENYIKK